MYANGYMSKLIHQLVYSPTLRSIQIKYRLILDLMCTHMVIGEGSGGRSEIQLVKLSKHYDTRNGRRNRNFIKKR
jgi:hypothetical protein